MEASKDSIQPAEYQCSICCELLLYPVVGKSGLNTVAWGLGWVLPI